MDFSGLIKKQVIVHLNGGREVTGNLQGYDQVSNLVLDEVVEIFRGNSVNI